MRGIFKCNTVDKSNPESVLCRACHADAEGLVEEGKLVGPEKLGVRVDALVKTVDPLHFDRLHGVVAGHWSHKNSKKKLAANSALVRHCELFGGFIRSKIQSE